jgi:4-hydroxybenzoate polyprenyltransferase
VHASALVRASHPGPTVAVTLVATLLAVGADLAPAYVVLVGLAVLCGQLVIGWTNDVVDAGRDRQVGRSDKPVATGEVSVRTTTTAAAAALAGCVAFSAALGWRAALCHLVLLVGSGLVYDLGAKGTRWSWLPYAVAFGSLPAVPTLAQNPSAAPPWWLVAAGALLGVGAHLVNVLPDLEDDAATGVRGLPHRMGARASQLGAAAVLLAAAASLLLGPHQGSGGWRWLMLVVNAGLAAVVAVGGGRTPFRVAMLMALIDVVLLTTSGQASA